MTLLQERFRSVILRIFQPGNSMAPGASQKRLGASPERPSSTKRVPEVAPRHKKECQGASGSVPRRRKSRLSRTREGKHRTFFAWLAWEALSERCSLEFPHFCLVLPSPRTLESTAPAGKNEGSALGAASPVARAMAPQKTTKNVENRNQNRTKIV